MSRARLWRGLAFAVLAGALVPIGLVAIGAPYAHPRPLALFLLATVVAHPAFIARDLRSGFQATALGALLAFLLVPFAHFPALVFVSSLVILAITRSALIYPRPFARALFYELAFNGAAVAAAASFDDGSLIGAAFSFWTFWLVQSGFALVPGGAKGRSEPRIDPFEQARAAAIALLERRSR